MIMAKQPNVQSGATLSKAMLIQPSAGGIILSSLQLARRQAWVGGCSLTVRQTNKRIEKHTDQQSANQDNPPEEQDSKT
jgi:uncharacterized membrane protein affecting hemolysin expression